MKLPIEDALAREVMSAIKGGHTEALRQLLQSHEGLAGSRIVTPVGQPGAGERTLLHVATDWPGHYPHVGETIRILMAAGARSEAFGDSHAETPLHWAASSDDVEAIDALLEGGADIEAPGSVIAGGNALEDAVAFGQWKAAHRLAERGARITHLWQASGLGRVDLTEALAAGADARQLAGGLWSACFGGQRATAELLLDLGADINWIGWDHKTPLDAAATGAGGHLVPWLRERGALSARQVADSAGSR